MGAGAKAGPVPACMGSLDGMTSAHASPVADSSLPDGRLFAVTWGIPDRFGGMTSALLHRSRAFVRIAARPVEILTFDGRPDYPAVRERLEREGRLVPGMRLRNLYEDLGSGTLAPAPDTIVVEPRASQVAAGAVIEHRRADGTVAVLDERMRQSGPPRVITWFDRSDEPARQWTSARACYADWLDALVGTEAAILIVDSKTTATFMARSRRPNVTNVHVVHNSHLVGSGRPIGMLRPSRRAVFTHLERFDGVVFLTERQRADAARLLSDPGNLAVVPNAIDAPARAPLADRDRDPAAGVVVAQLTPRKRVSHAIDAVARCRSLGAHVTLRIFGDGPDAPAARSRVRDAGLDGAVTFAGHRPDAAEAFGSASWTLLTSTAEGSPLVLAEAMARGCIPIAYDVPYGPADLITDGVDGLLVPAGDRDAAAAAIARVASLPGAERERVREAARAAAARFDDAHMVAEWGRVLRAAQRRHERPTPPIAASVEHVRLRYLRGRLRASVRLRGVPPEARVVLTLAGRGRGGALVRTRRMAPTGRLVWRLDPSRTRLVGPRHPLTCTIAVELEGSHQELTSVTLFPDARSLARRVARRLARRPVRRG
jgi:poly(glycerol-phosphate) alpha-glucosyltransferase